MRRTIFVDVPSECDQVVAKPLDGSTEDRLMVCKPVAEPPDIIEFSMQLLAPTSAEIRERVHQARLPQGGLITQLRVSGPPGVR